MNIVKSDLVNWNWAGNTGKNGLKGVAKELGGFGIPLEFGGHVRALGSFWVSGQGGFGGICAQGNFGELRTDRVMIR